MTSLPSLPHPVSGADLAQPVDEVGHVAQGGRTPRIAFRARAVGIVADFARDLGAAFGFALAAAWCRATGEDGFHGASVGAAAPMRQCDRPPD